MDALAANKPSAVSSAARKQKSRGADAMSHSRARGQLTSLHLQYQSVCEDQQRAAVRNEALLQDVRRLKHQLSLAAAQTSRVDALKHQYEEYIAVAYPQWLAEVHRVSRERDQEHISPLPPPLPPPSASSPSEVSRVSSQPQVCPHPVANRSESSGVTITSKHHPAMTTAALHQEELAASSPLPLCAPRPAISDISLTPTGAPPQTSSPVTAPEVSSLRHPHVITTSPISSLGVSSLRQPHVITTSPISSLGDSSLCQPHVIAPSSISLSYQCEPHVITTRPIMHTKVAPISNQQVPPTPSTVTSIVQREKLQTAPPARIPGGRNIPLHAVSHLQPSRIPVMVSGRHRSPFPAPKQKETPQPAKSIHPPPESKSTISIAPHKTVSEPVNRSENDLFTSLLPTTTEQQPEQSPEPTGGHEPVGMDATGTFSANLRTKLPVTYPDPSSPEVESRPVISHQIKPVVVDPTKPVVSDSPEEQPESTEPSDAHSNPANHRSAQEPSQPSSMDPVKLLEDLTLSSLSDSTHDLVHSLQEGAPPTGAAATGIVGGVPLEHGCLGDSSLAVSQASVEQGNETPSPSPLSLSPVEGFIELDSEVVIVNLLSTLDAHLAGDQESSSLMYTAPLATNDMKEQIAASAMLTSTLTRAARRGEDISTWDVGSLSTVLLQQLAHMSHTSGSLVPGHMTEDSVTLYTSGDQLSSELSAGWGGVWPRLLEHMQLLHHCGRKVEELAAIFSPVLITTDSPTRREKASLQLLTVLQFYMPLSEDSLPPSTPSGPQEASVVEDAPLNETEAYHSLAQLSQHSSLLSEGSAIAEIERELQVVMGEEVEERKPTPARSGSSVLRTPLNRPPSPLGSDDSDGSSSHSSFSPIVPSYVPTVVEQRSQASQASKSSVLKKRLGFWGDLDSEGSDLDFPAVTPLNEDKEDFDFYG